MCLAIPHQISKIRRTKATTKDNHILDSSLVSVKIGDWVLEQNGLIIAKISSEQANYINRYLKNPKSQILNSKQIQSSNL